MSSRASKKQAQWAAGYAALSDEKKRALRYLEHILARYENANDLVINAYQRVAYQAVYDRLTIQELALIRVGAGKKWRLLDLYAEKLKTHGTPGQRFAYEIYQAGKKTGT